MSHFIAAPNPPRITQELYDYIAKKVPQLEVIPGMSQDELMYVAGQHKVLEHLALCLKQTSAAAFNNRET